MQDFEWGWRLNLSLAAVPALLLMLGAALVPDTPNSLVERGQEEKGKQMLRKIRGVQGEWKKSRLAAHVDNVPHCGCDVMHGSAADVWHVPPQQGA